MGKRSIMNRGGHALVSVVSMIPRMTLMGIGFGILGPALVVTSIGLGGETVGRGLVNTGRKIRFAAVHRGIDRLSDKAAAGRQRVVEAVHARRVAAQAERAKPRSRRKVVKTALDPAAAPA